MAGEFSYCPVQTKQLSKHKISVCAWSPKTDLIALGTQAGFVSVHRYKLSCIWESVHTDLGCVTCLSWRPDGQTLCASYSSGVVHLYLTNDGFVYHTLSHPLSVTHLNWIGHGTNLKATPVTHADNFFPDLNTLTMFKSDTNFTSSDTFKLSQLLRNVNESLTVLTVLCGEILHLYGSGIFHIARWHLAPKLRPNAAQTIVLACQFSSSLRFLWILYSYVDERGMHYVELDQAPCSALLNCGQQLRTLSIQNSSMRICKSLIDWSFSQICVSWEDMILEVDAKFTKYGRDRLAQNKNWSLSVELLEFILFGNCPFALRKFLVEDWTAANLKRTGTATLKAYESIKTICFQQLQLLLQRLLFHTSELLGLVRDTPHYAQFGITPSQVIKLCSTTASVLQKTQELYLVIEKSVAHLRAFFKWLYVAIPGLSGRVLPDDFTRVTPNERELVIDFITNYLQPVFVQGELQSYHVDLVEQYIRHGEVRKPLESVVKHDIGEDKERVQLRDLVNLTCEQLISEKFPVGMFHFSPKATLADLIQKSLQDDLDAVFQAPTAENFTRGCLDFDQTCALLLSCSISPQPPLDQPLVAFHILSEPSVEVGQSRSVFGSNKTLLAWQLPMLDSANHNSLVLMELESEKITSEYSQLSVIVTVDDLPCVTNPHNVPYELVDFQFYTSDLLLLLLCRANTPGGGSVRSDATHRPVSSWLVMLHVGDLFNSIANAQSTHQSTSLPLWSSERTPATLIHQIRLSEKIVEANVQSLPWHAVKIATNGDRSIVFVLFHGLSACRVYLLERLEADEQGDETMREPDENQTKAEEERSNS